MWTETRVAVLRSLWANGLSAGQIALHAEIRDGAWPSRNAVIGKVHRMGLTGRYYPAKSRKKDRARHAKPAMILRPKFRADPLPPLKDDLERIAALRPVDPNLTIDRLTPLACRYPIGDPKEAGFTYCGRTCEGAWCAEHRKLVYKREELAPAEGLTNLIHLLEKRGPVFMTWAA